MSCALTSSRVHAVDEVLVNDRPLWRQLRLRTGTCQRNVNRPALTVSRLRGPRRGGERSLGPPRTRPGTAQMTALLVAVTAWVGLEVALAEPMLFDAVTTTTTVCPRSAVRST
jgi:hypothetical protein